MDTASIVAFSFVGVTLVGAIGGLVFIGQYKLKPRSDRRSPSDGSTYNPELYAGIGTIDMASSSHNHCDSGSSSSSDSGSSSSCDSGSGGF